EIAMFIIAYNYKGRINNFANIIVRAKSYMSECLFAAQHLNEIFDESKYPIEHFGDKTLTDVKGIIEFKNVSFGYNEGSNVLNNINLTFSPNKVSAIVGLSGAGKSTIVSLINRLYDIKDGEGEILLDGTNIKELTRNSLRTNICCITQNPYIYNMTVRENLLLAKTDATEEEIISALKDSNIYDFIEKLEKGLDSTLGENGVKLSGGQKQRIAIARAILKNSKVIIFDEATSALDNINQAEIKKTIAYLAKEHTVVVVAHRLSTIVDADNIIFIKDGNVFVQGKHKDLIKTCQDYKNLYIEEEIDLKEDDQ
ncbi:MAG: ABC transporter ATP-binding protein, partial [Eubacteriales bacterium]|nr:ABC transporter ATP-binding protein [Eubacteriales bacterium]